MFNFFSLEERLLIKMNSMRKICFQCQSGQVRQILLRHYTAATLTGTSPYFQSMPEQLERDTDNAMKWSKDITIRNSDQYQQTPLAILLGWGNGPYKHLSKYSQLFEKHDFTTVCLTTSLSKLMIRPTTMSNQYCADVMNAATELTNKNKDRPVIIMTFSNSGMFVFDPLIHHLQKQSLNLVGTMFDSCPTPINEKLVKSSENAALASLKSSPFKSVAKNIARAFSWLIVQTHSERTERPYPGPQLFLYSEADHVIDYKDVEDFAKERMLIGADVRMKKFKSSKHVRHLNENPEEYTKEVDTFIQKCLKYGDVPLENFLKPSFEKPNNVNLKDILENAEFLKSLF